MKLQEIIKGYGEGRVTTHRDGCSEGYLPKYSIVCEGERNLVIQAKLYNMDTLEEVDLEGLPVEIDSGIEILKGGMIKRQVDKDTITIKFPRATIKINVKNLQKSCDKNG